MEKLTKELAENKIEVIKKISGDYEMAHATEDGLLGYFVECISLGMYEKEEAIEIAKIVMETYNIEFERYCA